MKSFFLIGSALLLSINMSCKKCYDHHDDDPGKPGGRMTVIRDCTGTYLRQDGKDYNVCNLSILDAYRDGATVHARFRRVTECTEASDRIICMMFHENEGWIQVEHVR